MKQAFPFLFVFVSFLAFGCASSTKTGNERSAHFITFGEGGGVSGFSKGYIFYDSGLVEEWSERPSEEKKRTTLFHTTTDSISFFFRMLDEINFPMTNFTSAGDMTQFIEETTGEQKHRVYWRSGDSDAPAEARTFYTLATRYAHRHKQN